MYMPRYFSLYVGRTVEMLQERFDVDMEKVFIVYSANRNDAEEAIRSLVFYGHGNWQSWLSADGKSYTQSDIRKLLNSESIYPDSNINPLHPSNRWL